MSGIDLPSTVQFEKVKDKSVLDTALIVAPPGAINGSWMNPLKKYSLAVASGWMAIRGNRRRRGADRGFVLSDHCDWDDLNTAIRECGAENIYPTHGNTTTFSRWLQEEGYNAQPIETEFGDDPEKG